MILKKKKSSCDTHLGVIHVPGMALLGDMMRILGFVYFYLSVTPLVC